MTKHKCNCQIRIRDEIKCEPSAGHDYVDEVLGLLRVARGQRDLNQKLLEAEIFGNKKLLRENDELRAALAKQPNVRS
jgi:hypothetical protein